MLSISSPNVFSIVLFVISGFSLPVHIFGGYCILFKTPLVMKSVKWTLFNLHFWSAALDILLSLLAQPFLCSPFLAGFPLGILKFAPTDVLVLVLKTVFMRKFLAWVKAYETFKNSSKQGVHKNDRSDKAELFKNSRRQRLSSPRCFQMFPDFSQYFRTF